MKSFKNKWLRASVLSALVLGGIFAVKAFEQKDVKLTQVADEVHFEYTPPTGSSTPYSQANVRNTLNWTVADNPCTTPTLEQIPCSISVPIDNTEGGNGTTIDSTQVSIEAISSTTGQFMVDAPTTTSGYTNPVNRALN